MDQTNNDTLERQRAIKRLVRELQNLETAEREALTRSYVSEA